MNIWFTATVVKHIPTLATRRDAIRLDTSETAPAAACDVLGIAVKDVNVALLGTPGEEGRGVFEYADGG